MDKQYLCPKCGIGELYDTGTMFVAVIKCDNPKCDYESCDLTGCISGDITD